MPLIVGGSQVSNIPYTTQEWIERYPHFQEIATHLIKQPVRKVNKKKLLYVMQRELAVIAPREDDTIEIIGTEDATTCHIGIITHSGSKAVGLCHFDGYETEQCCKRMVEKLKLLSHGIPGRLELHLIGGFMDDRKISMNLTKELSDAFHDCDEEIHIATFCVTDLNDVLKGEIHFPVIYGVGVDVKTGEIFRAEFPDKGPALNLRHSRIFAGVDKIWDIYDNDKHQLIVEPFSFVSGAVYQAKMWSKAPDSMILEHLSTSGDQEPEGYADQVRNVFKFILANPDTTTIFNGKSLRFNLNADGQWTQ
ncbi:protein N-terminal asparagine amidohydrolase-like [Tubulanus polymorphus]|uniref:protein N-terminal asparagine amidohydrolase-like n=1 Tax=Tubulanus polymorphus TaxID=672921 RepID=UPI003DA5D5B7